MTEKPITKSSFNGLTFRASGKVTKRHFMPKVVSRKVTVNDAFEKHFRSSLSTFIPKLSPRFMKPHLMFHVSNGASSCLIRFKEPEELIKTLEEIICTLRSDKWLDAWWRVCDISEDLQACNQIALDEEIVDINAWNKELENKLSIDVVEVKKENGGEV